MGETMKEAFTYRMKAFEIEGQPIGPLILVLKRDSYELTAYLEESGTSNRSSHGFIHPHVYSSGRIDFGGASGLIRQLVKDKGDPYELLNYAAGFLRDVYCPSDSYQRIGNWTASRPVYVLNVRLTTHNGSDVECWGVFNDRDAAETRLITPGGITWHTLGDEPRVFDGHPNTDCDDHFPGLVEASATIDKHIVQE